MSDDYSNDNEHTDNEHTDNQNSDDELLAQMVADEETQESGASGQNTENENGHAGEANDASADNGDDAAEGSSIDDDIDTIASTDDEEYGTYAYEGTNWSAIDDIIKAVATLHRSPIEKRRALGALYYGVTDDNLLKARPFAEIIDAGRTDKALMSTFITGHLITVHEAMTSNDFAAAMRASRDGAEWAYSIPDTEKRNVWRAFEAVHEAFPAVGEDGEPLAYKVARTTKKTQGNEIAAMLDDLIGYVDIEALAQFRQWEAEVVGLLDPGAVA